MKKILLILFIAFTFTYNLFADDLGWKSIYFTSNGGTIFSLDIHLTAYQYSFGKSYNADIWVHVSNYMVSSAKAVVLNYRNNKLVETKEFELIQNPEKKVLEAPVPYGLASLTYYDENYRLQPTYQEIVIQINDGQWLKVSGTDNSNFYFNIFELFGIM